MRRRKLEDLSSVPWERYAAVFPGAHLVPSLLRELARGTPDVAGDLFEDALYRSGENVLTEVAEEALPFVLGLAEGELAELEALFDWFAALLDCHTQQCLSYEAVAAPHHAHLSAAQARAARTREQLALEWPLGVLRLEHPRPEVRLSALGFLSECRPAAPALTEALRRCVAEDAREEVAASAVFAMAKLDELDADSARAWALDERALPRLAAATVGLQKGLLAPAECVELLSELGPWATDALDWRPHHPNDWWRESFEGMQRDPTAALELLSRWWVQARSDLSWATSIAILVAQLAASGPEGAQARAWIERHGSTGDPARDAELRRCLEGQRLAWP